MHCQNCGTVLPDGTPSCPTCGMRFAAPQTPYPVQPPVEPGQGVPAQPYPPQPSAYPEPQAAYPPVQQPPAYPAQQPPPSPAQSPDPVQPVQPDPVPSAPPRKKRRTGLIVGIIVGVVVLLCAAAAAALLLLAPVTSTKTTTGVPAGAYAPVMPDVSTEASAAAIDTAANTAAENVVTAFYDAANAGQFPALAALVTPDTRSAVDPGAFEGWSTTTFQIARSVVDGDTALVYGRESRRAFGSKDLGVKFTLVRDGGTWLIENWQAVDEGAVNGAMPSTGAGSGATALTDATARDLVSSLLQARQVGDAETIRLLTTAKFQTDNGSAWLDGVDNTPFFTAFSIKSVKKSGAKYIVTVVEQWNSGAETATYTVIDAGGTILVDAWTSKQ